MPKSEIKIGKWGLILEGRHRGMNLRIEPTGDNFIILIKDPKVENRVFNYWISNRDDLEEAFVEAAWRIDWELGEPSSE